MIRFPFWLLSKKTKVAWIESKEKTLSEKYSDVISKTTLEYERELSEIKSNHIKVLESKATPDSIWVDGFSKGYEKAFDTILPIVQKGIDKSVELIEQQAIEKTLARLDETIISRSSFLESVEPKSMLELQRKREELEKKLETAKGVNDLSSISKYTYYLEALSWMLNANGLHQDKSSTK